MGIGRGKKAEFSPKKAKSAVTRTEKRHVWTQGLSWEWGGAAQEKHDSRAWGTVQRVGAGGTKVVVKPSGIWLHSNKQKHVKQKEENGAQKQ